MTNASASTNPAVTIDPAEAAHFGKLAADWWDPKGASAMLHKLNPPRLTYLRRQIDAHWGGDSKDRRPLVNKRALDAGCGAGLLAEPLARLGASVIAIDAAPENIAAARAHAAGQNLVIDYRTGELDTLAAQRGSFDLVICMEVIEHVSDPAAFVHGLAAMLSGDGLLVLSTPNRTALSRLALITLGEGVAGIPRGTHDWNRFHTPDELEALLKAAGLRTIDRTGLSLSPARGFVLSDNLAIDYFLTATR